MVSCRCLLFFGGAQPPARREGGIVVTIADIDVVPGAARAAPRPGTTRYREAGICRGELGVQLPGTCRVSIEHERSGTKKFVHFRI